jgi:glucose-6-phosphate-specific signal transduction histidine kinase
MSACPCTSPLNIVVCRVSECSISGRFIASAPFIAGALVVLISGGVAAFTVDRLLDRSKPSQADAADYADFISEATGVVAALATLIIGLIVVASQDSVKAIVILVGAFLLAPLAVVVWRFVSQRDPTLSVRKKRGRRLGWRSYIMIAANLVAVFLVVLII